MMKFLRRLSYWTRQRKLDADLAEEMEFHRRMLTAEGAAHELGNATLMRENARAVWIWPWLESVWQDVAYAVRNLRRQPGFTLVAVVALASAIGVNTSLFSVFNSMALRPWPVKDPGRMVNIFRQEKRDIDGFSLAEFRYLAQHSKTFAGMIAMRNNNFDLDRQKVRSAWVSGNFFSVLGVQMQLGRGFMPEEDLVESPQPVVVLSYITWRDRFGSDPAIVGKQVHLADVPFTVVGVTSVDFTGTSPDRVDFWGPFPAWSLLEAHESWVKDFLRKPTDCCANVAGRLAPGVAREQARAEIAVLSQQFHAQFKLENSAILLTGTAFFNSSPRAKAGIIPIFALMLGGVLLILLLACANVGNLLLARAAARRREITVRLSLGAGRQRVIRQLMTESLVLAFTAGAVGVALAYRLPKWVLNAFISEPLTFRLEPDASVLSFALILCVMACAIFGLAPALHGTRMSVTGTRLRLRSGFLAVQVAASVVLLVGAGLLTRGVQRARVQDPGFAIRDVAVVSVDLPADSYNASRTRTFFTQLMQDLRDLQPLGMTRTVPLSSQHNFTSFRLPGENENRDDLVLYHEVSAGYFDVLRLPMVAGRNFEAADAARKVIIINETMARRYWSGGSALGKTVISDSPREIVGIVKDAYTTDLDNILPTLYQPISGGTIPQLLVRKSSTDPSQPIAAAAQRIDPRVRVRSAPLSENLDRWLDGTRVGAGLAAALGMLALTLASIGMFGVFAYWVQQRTQEIGIRMALGAQPSQVVRVVLSASAQAVLVGLAIGFVGAFAGSRLLHRYLFGLSPLDPISYGGAALVLAVASLAATYWPARRATRIDPIAALRSE
jgi:predicted permease